MTIITRRRRTPSESEAERFISYIRCSGPDESIDEVLDSLVHYQKCFSEAPELNVISCIIKFITNEIYYHAQPSWLVKKFACVMGGLIERNIFSNEEDLRAVQSAMLEALGNKPGTKDFHFGVHAIMSCQQVLFKYPEIWTKLKFLPGFYQMPEELVEHVSSGKIRVELLFYHMTQMNVKQQSAKVKKVLSRKYFSWLSEYIVTRVSKEIESHGLLNEFMDCFNSVPFEKMVELDTVKTIKILSKKQNRTAETNNVLLNLGHWLGMLTLGREKPVSIHFDLLKLIDKAVCENSSSSVFELKSVLGFVVELLKSSKNAKAFGPQTQWTKSILNRLSEIRNTQTMRPNEMFQIGSLFVLLNYKIEPLSMSTKYNNDHIRLVIPRETEKPNNIRLDSKSDNFVPPTTPIPPPPPPPPLPPSVSVSPTSSKDTKSIKPIVAGVPGNRSAVLFDDIRRGITLKHVDTSNSSKFSSNTPVPRTDLLNQIKRGVQLKPVQLVDRKNVKMVETNSVAGLLHRVLAQRSTFIHGDDSSSDSNDTDDDDDDWSD